MSEQEKVDYRKKLTCLARKVDKLILACPELVNTFRAKTQPLYDRYEAWKKADSEYRPVYTVRGKIVRALENQPQGNPLCRPVNHWFEILKTVKNQPPRNPLDDYKPIEQQYIDNPPELRTLPRFEDAARQEEQEFVFLAVVHDFCLTKCAPIITWPKPEKDFWTDLDSLQEQIWNLLDLYHGDKTALLESAFDRIAAGQEKQTAMIRNTQRQKADCQKLDTGDDTEKPHKEPLHNTGDNKSAKVTTTEEAKQAYQLYNCQGITQTEVAKTMSKIKKKPYNQGQISRLINKHRKFLEANGLPIAKPPKIKKTALNPSIIDMGARTDGRKRPDPRNLKQ